MIYQVGMHFPIVQYMGAEGIYPICTNGSFDMLVIMQEVNEDAIRIFDGRCKHCAIQISDIPFLSFTFEKTLELGFYINVYDAKPRNVDAWLKLNVNRSFNFYLVEQKQSIIKAARTRLFPANFLKGIKRILAKQHQHYSSWEQVDATGAAQYFKEKTLKMMQQWKNPPVINIENKPKPEMDDEGWTEIIERP
jgi:hypothetical protein